MTFKPMKKRDYIRWIKPLGWQLKKAGTDWKLVDQEGKTIIRNIIIPHPPGDEISNISVQKTENMMKAANHFNKKTE